MKDRRGLRILPTALAVVPLAFVLVGSPTEVQGQIPGAAEFETGLTTGIGYTAQYPDATVGVGIWRLFGSNRSFGVFADAKGTRSSMDEDQNFCPPDLSVCGLEGVPGRHLPMVDYNEYRIFNAGGMYAPTDGFAFFLGAGVVQHTRLHEFFDPAEEVDERITPEGYYIVPGARQEYWTQQAVVGILLRFTTRLAVRMGYESAPGGMSVGGYFLMDR